jgi:hypothetical protein
MQAVRGKAMSARCSTGQLTSSLAQVATIAPVCQWQEEASIMWWWQQHSWVADDAHRPSHSGSDSRCCCFMHVQQALLTGLLARTARAVLIASLALSVDQSMGIALMMWVAGLHAAIMVVVVSHIRFCVGWQYHRYRLG